MQAFDATIANVALPQLEHSLGGGVELGSWVMTSYLCASAVTATLTGWLRRRFGARQVFTAAITLFALASVLCALAPFSLALIQFRLLQGAAAGVIQPLAQATLLDIYPQKDHGRMLAIWGATIMTGPILGPVLGGVITDLASWRWVFALNLPLGLIAVFGLRGIPALTRSSAAADIDCRGIALLVVGIGALQLALQRSIGRTWPVSAEILAEVGLAVLALTILAMRSVRSRVSPFKFEVFCNRNFGAAVFYNFMVAALLFTSIVFLPALSEGALGFDATQAGLALFPRGIGTMATMLAVGYIIDKIDHRILLAIGLMITVAALALISRVPAQGGGVWLAAASAIQGIGVGLLFTPLSTLAFATLGVELRTDAAGIYSLLRQLGCATGIAAMTALLQARIQTSLLASSDQGGGDVFSRALDVATFAAYTGCFQTMAVITAMIIPGIMLFRVLRRDRVPAAAE